MVTVSGGTVDRLEIVKRIKHLQIEARRLEELRAEIRALQGLLVEQRMKKIRLRGERFGPTKAIMSILSEGPRSMKEVVDMAATRMDTKSKDARKTVYTVFGHLRKHGVVMMRDDGTAELGALAMA